MQKFTFSAIAISCTIALSACSSSSKGNSDNSAQLRKTEDSLRQQLLDIEKKATEAKQTANRAQTQSTDTERKLKEEAEKVTKLNAELAATIAKEKDAEKKLAEAELEKERLKLANQQATNDRIKALEEKAQQAGAALESAKANAEKANAEVEKLKLAEQQAQAEREAAATRLKELENLQADEKKRIPISDQVFGGTNGKMDKLVSGGTLIKDIDENWSVTAPAISEDGFSYLTVVVDKAKGKVRRFPLSEPGFGSFGESYGFGTPALVNNSETYPNVRFGAYTDDETGYKYAYSQGIATPEAQIPTTGSFEYKGHAAYIKDGVSYDNASKLNAQVDFTNKTVDLHIEKRGRVPEMRFAAKITANSFAGEVNGIKTQGGFFGENASQLSGLYINEAEKSRGAYGAIKTNE